MDPLIKHSLSTGLVTMAQLSEVTQLDEVILVNALTGNTDLNRVTAGLALIFCTDEYKKRNHVKIAEPIVGKSYRVRHIDSRGSLNIPKKFRVKAHTENYKLTEAIDAYGHPVLMLSGAHLPDPDFNFPPVETPVMPAPEVNNA